MKLNQVPLKRCEKLFPLSRTALDNLCYHEILKEMGLHEARNRIRKRYHKNQFAKLSKEEMVDFIVSERENRMKERIVANG